MAEIKAAKGQGPPEDVVPIIEPFPDLIWAWNAFWRLSNRRPQGMNGPLRIPDSEVLAHVKLMGWSVIRRQDFVFYCDKMDEAYMGFVAKLQEEEERKRESREHSKIPARKR